MLKALTFIREKLPYLILAVILLGLANGYWFDVSSLKVVVTPILFLMVYPMMINLRVEEVFRSKGVMKPVLLSLGVNFLVSPILAYVLVQGFFGSNPMLGVGLAIIALIPTSGMTASWTGLAGGNLRLALVIISANLLLAIVLLPLLLQLMIGKVIAVNVWAIVKSLAVVVIAPLILGDLTRRGIIRAWGQKAYQAIKPHFASVSSLGVLAIVFVAVSLKSRSIFAQSDIVLLSLVPLTLYYAGMLLVSTLLGKHFLQEENATALVYGSTMRNLTIALGLTLGAFRDVEGGGMAVFLIALAYMVQVPMAAFYMKYVKRAI